MEFKELDLHPDLRRGLEDAGYVTCMPVQEKVFPHAFAGKDIYAQSQTGTGKTAAFLISIFQRIMTVNEEHSRKVLILAPTRELAAQIEGEAEKLGKYLDIKCGAFYGGVSYGPQVDMLRNNVQVIIGTPGRVQDLVTQGKMLLRDVGFLVIAEADRMIGYLDQSALSSIAQQRRTAESAYRSGSGAAAMILETAGMELAMQTERLAALREREFAVIDLLALSAGVAPDTLSSP